TPDSTTLLQRAPSPVRLSSSFRLDTKRGGPSTPRSLFNQCVENLHYSCFLDDLLGGHRPASAVTPSETVNSPRPSCVSMRLPSPGDPPSTLPAGPRPPQASGHAPRYRPAKRSSHSRYGPSSRTRTASRPRCYGRQGGSAGSPPGRAWS